MRLKTFTAPTLAEAQAALRRALGEDAIIVATDGGGGKSVTITAAVERPDDDPLGLPEPPGPDTDRDRHPHRSGVGDLAADLERAGVGDALAARLTATVAALGLDDDPVLALAAALDDRYRFQPLADRAPASFGGAPLVLVGPPGSGKTVTAAKLAALATLSGRTPVLASTDTVRAGGMAQLAALAGVLGVACQALAGEDAVAAMVGALGDAPDSVLGGDRIAIIDTQATNPFDLYDMAKLGDLIAAAGGEPVLVVAAGGDAVEMAETADAFAALGVVRFIATRADMTRRLGGVLGVAEAAGLRFADAGISPHAASGLQPLTPVALARLLLPGAPSSTRVRRDAAREFAA